VSTLQKIKEVIASHKGNGKELVRRLHRQKLRHLSWSQLSTVERCPYEYYLAYVKHIPLDPEPDYFVKGRLFHEAAQGYYRAICLGRSPRSTDFTKIIKKHKNAVARTHLSNAVEMLIRNAFTGWEVIGVEKPFALDLGPDLPPCVGVIDLVLKRANTFAVVDHKTARRMWPQDPMQVAIYREHILEEFGAQECRAFFDMYRWVNNLDSIRTPAFLRKSARLSQKSFPRAVQRFEKGYAQIRQIEETGTAKASGDCWMCAYRSVCNRGY